MISMPVTEAERRTIAAMILVQMRSDPDMAMACLKTASEHNQPVADVFAEQACKQTDSLLKELELSPYKSEPKR